MVGEFSNHHSLYKREENKETNKHWHQTNNLAIFYCRKTQKIKTDLIPYLLFKYMCVCMYVDLFLYWQYLTQIK